MAKAKGSAGDTLRSSVNELREHLQQQGTPLFFGLDPESAKNVVRAYWRNDLGGDWREFLKRAQELGAKPIYLFWSEFSDFDLLDAGDELRAEYEQHVGEVCMFNVSFLYNGVLHIYDQAADWYTEYEDLTDIGDLEDDPFDDDELNDRPF